MTKDKEQETLKIEEVPEGLEVIYHDAGRKEDLVAALHQPWIGDEGPMEAEFRQEFEPSSLRPRGLAFDQKTTVYWDEDVVMEVQEASKKKGEIAFRTRVLVRSRFPGADGLELYRIDVLREGALRASRYVWRAPEEGIPHA